MYYLESDAFTEYLDRIMITLSKNRFFTFAFILPHIAYLVGILVCFMLVKFSYHQVTVQKHEYNEMR